MSPSRLHSRKMPRRRRSKRQSLAGRAKSPLFLLLLLGVSLLAPTANGLVTSASQYQPRTLHLGWEGVVRQSSFNTCGPAAIATLLSHVGRPTSEAAIVAEARLDVTGVTLAEFSRLANQHGLTGEWVRVLAAAQLQQLPPLSVAHLDDFSGHFVLILADAGDFILLADPARGRLLVPRSLFLEQWSNLLFVLEPAET